MATEHASRHPEQHPTSQFAERYFSGNTPEEKIAEVNAFVKALGLKPEQPLVRIFNGGLLATMKVHGTDRVGIDEVDTRRHEFGVDEVYNNRLKALGLRRDDGLYALPLSQWAPIYTADFFKYETFVPAHRTAIAIYNGDLLLGISDGQPASVRASQGLPEDEFYYFKDPKHKVDALLGVISEVPLEIEQEFAILPNNDAKILFLQQLLPTFNRKTQDIIRELIFDVQRDIAIRLSHQSKGETLKTQLITIGKLIAATNERTDQLDFIEMLKNHARLIREKGEDIPWISVDSILKRINQELAKEGLPDTYRQKLQQLAEEVQYL